VQSYYAQTEVEKVHYHNWLEEQKKRKMNRKSKIYQVQIFDDYQSSLILKWVGENLRFFLA